jgi:lipid-A-disaccharide synthase
MIDGDSYNILSISDFALVASGTATLETAIIGTPFVIMYRVGIVNYIAYRIVAKIRILGLVNVIAGRIIVPEFLQYDATPEKIAQGSLEILHDDSKRAAMEYALAQVKSSLGTPGASLRAARAILPYLS